MTKLLSDMLEKVKTWPASRQEDAALMLQEMERQGTDIYHLSDEERAAVQEGLAQADRGEFATDEEMAALWKRFGL